MRSGGPAAPAPVPNRSTRRVRSPSTPSSVSMRTQSRAMEGTSAPLTEKTGPAGAKSGSVIEALRRDAPGQPFGPPAGFAPALIDRDSGRVVRLVLDRPARHAAACRAVGRPDVGVNLVDVHGHGSPPLAAARGTGRPPQCARPCVTVALRRLGGSAG